MPGFVMVTIAKSGKRVLIDPKTITAVQELEHGPGCTIIVSEGLSVFNVVEDFDEVQDQIDEVAR